MKSLLFLGPILAAQTHTRHVMDEWNQMMFVRWELRLYECQCVNYNFYEFLMGTSLTP